MTSEAVIATSIRNGWIERYGLEIGQQIMKGDMPAYDRFEWMAVVRFATWLSENNGFSDKYELVKDETN